MLTAASTVAARVHGLGLGADDYLPKPFDFAELVARIRALGRRSAAALPPVLDRGDISLDPSRRVAFRAGRRLELSPKEFSVLLGETLDSLFGRLEASFESQRRFVANASHELRTPLTAERTLLQVALADPDADAQTLRATCQELLVLGEQQEHLIEALLTLACSERGVDRRDSFDLADVARKVIMLRRQEAEQRGIRVDASLSPAPATGDPDLTESLVANLVDNALRYNRADGRVEIGTGTKAGRPVISVGNTGQPVPPEEVDGLFQPFERLGRERTGHDGGHGLGLAIVRAIADAHGATLTANARPGGGLDIEASFPAGAAQNQAERP